MTAFDWWAFGAFCALVLCWVLPCEQTTSARDRFTASLIVLIVFSLITAFANSMSNEEELHQKLSECESRVVR